MPNSTFPRLVLAGLSGGTGKTILSLGLTRALSRSGRSVVPFKKGPDYIDAAWLGLAAGRACSNLDPYFLDRDTLRSLFAHRAAQGDIAVVEGNRGLFDGMDEQGSCSTAELARQLSAPVILAIDCTKMTRTVAAIVAGCAAFEEDFHLAGVILNRTAGERHRSILRRSIETHTDIPVLGALPKLGENPIPERHMGLVPDQEFGSEGYETGQKALDALACVAEEWTDLDAIVRIAEQAADFGSIPAPLWPNPKSRRARIGYVLDAALWFYYQENLEALEHAGAELVPLSLLSDTPWPELDGLYLGGGFPETMAEPLAANESIRNHVRKLSEKGMPIYAECGGFMYLCEALEFEGRTYPMAGVFPVRTQFCPRPQGLGYTRAEAVLDSVFYARGDVISGHEFHYSLCVAEVPGDLSFSLKMLRGKGMLDGHDGLIMRNTFAGYNHIHALAVPQWAENFVSACTARR
ncbi:cobyrinate a,c-diamide synthase [Pseudodesulfovibrio tunisiensis]|uniref:cobyrinate a,c-diamide synthase n=1 Tax=Pseudodesulfovibrio tunisiensis TaxID=463192 RepID=UPI001FB35E0A|nr:cobyrinate a,c-diamide synthase [Pseudodesulfovibrio tunisiensis]